jgi:hypothetical protein
MHRRKGALPTNLVSFASSRLVRPFAQAKMVEEDEMVEGA